MLIRSASLSLCSEQNVSANECRVFWAHNICLSQFYPTSRTVSSKREIMYHIPREHRDVPAGVGSRLFLIVSESLRALLRPDNANYEFTSCLRRLMMWQQIFIYRELFKDAGKTAHPGDKAERYSPPPRVAGLNLNAFKQTPDLKRLA